GTITITKTATNVATVAFTGISLKVNGEASTITSYTATKSEVVKFEAVGGWDNANHILYLKEEKEVGFVMPSEASETVNITDLEHVDGTAELTENVDCDEYMTAWAASTTDSVELVTDNGHKYAKLNFKSAGSAHRFGFDLGLDKAFNALQFTFLNDGIATITIQLRNSENGVFAKYALNVLDNNIVIVNIRLDDENWKINYDNHDYKLTDALAILNMNDISEVVNYFDKVDVLIKIPGSTPDWKMKSIIMGDIIAKNLTAGTESSVEYQIENVPDRVLAITSNGVKYDVSIQSQTEGRIASLNMTKVVQGVTDEVVMPFTYTLSDDMRFVNVTSVATGAQAFSLKLKVVKRGTALEVVEASGLFQGFTGVLDTFKPMDVNMTFSTNTTSSWKQEVYTDAWKAPSEGKMYYKNENSLFINMSSDTYTRRNTYTFTSAERGICDFISVRLGNWFNGASSIQLKIKLVDVNGTETYLVGKNDFELFTTTSGTYSFHEVTWSLEKPVNVKEIVFVVKATAQSYLYIDDLKLQFKGYTVETKPLNVIPKHTDVLKLDFEDGSGNSAYSGANWTKQVSTDGGATWATGGGMNSRSKDNSKVVNMQAGKEKVFNYTYSTGSSLGEADMLLVKLGNYYNNAGTIKIKIVLTTTTNEKIFVAGGSASDKWFDVPFIANTGMTAYSFNFSEADIAAISVIIYSKNAGDVYLYVDDLTLGHSIEVA
ncbi:MAG: hypothetical protein K6F59_01140, partial [Gammaproteobacteria bacterium]|nr:hypothetical protein [Gammaproteobacteria bacterium]